MHRGQGKKGITILVSQKAKSKIKLTLYNETWLSVCKLSMKDDSSCTQNPAGSYLFHILSRTDLIADNIPFGKLCTMAEDCQGDKLSSG